MIDTHIHLDLYTPEQQSVLLSELPSVDVSALLSVSMDLASCKHNQTLMRNNPGIVHAAYGFHPEQALPDEEQITELFQWMHRHADEMVAVGEVGLPYYRRLDATRNGERFTLTPYIRLLERFIQLADKLHKPLILHAIYEDAAIVCDLLEKSPNVRAHFHWYKGDENTTARIVEQSHMISITPDICYETEIQRICQQVPIEQLMIETDGPWPFDGPFHGRMTHPSMMAYAIAEIARIKRISVHSTKRILEDNTRRMYRI